MEKFLSQRRCISELTSEVHGENFENRHRENRPPLWPPGQIDRCPWPWPWSAFDLAKTLYGPGPGPTYGDIPPLSGATFSGDVSCHFPGP